MPLTVSCNNLEKITVISNPRTDPSPGFPNGQPAPLDGPLKITVVEGDGSFEPPDPLTPLQFKAVSGSALANTVYSVKGDADMGTSVETIEDIVTLVVVGARARNFGLAAGPVELK